MSLIQQTSAPIALVATRPADTPIADVLSVDYPTQEVSGDNGLVDSLRNIPMPEIAPMPRVRFAPIPLLSGVVLPDDDKGKVVNKVEVTITCEDGSTTTITLDERNGGWWVPKDRLDG